MPRLTPDDLSAAHTQLALAVQDARELLASMDEDGEDDNEDRAAELLGYVADHFVAWVGKCDGHPYYTRQD